MSFDAANHSQSTLILHTTTPADWAQAQRVGQYIAESLMSEGFIHCSTPAQIADTANRHYTGQRNLILLHIDPTKLTAPLEYEPANGQYYPHIYGPINLDAVQSTSAYEPDAAGIFQPPVL